MNWLKLVHPNGLLNGKLTWALIALITFLTQIRLTSGINPYRTAENIEGFGLFDHGFGFGHLVTGPGFVYSPEEASSSGRFGPADLAVSGCRVPTTRLSAAASPPPFDQSLAGSGYSANSINRANCRLPKNSFLNVGLLGLPGGGSSRQQPGLHRRRKLSLMDATALLPEDLRRVIDPASLEQFTKEASGDYEDEAKIPGKLFFNEDDPLFTQTKNKHLFSAAFEQAKVENSPPVTSPKLKAPKNSGFDVKKLLQFHWSAVARVLGLPPGGLDETMFRIALKEQGKADRQSGRPTTPGIEEILKLPPGSLEEMLKSSAKAVLSPLDKHKPHLKAPKVPPAAEIKKQALAVLPNFDISHLDPREAFHWLFTASRKPPLIFDNIVTNVPSFYFSTIEEPIRVLPADHDEDTLPSSEHHFVQFSPIFPSGNTPTPPKNDTLEDKIKSDLSSQNDPSDDDDNDDEENEPPPQKRLIPFPYTKWDQPTAPSLLGLVGVLGTAVILAFFTGLAVQIHRMWDFELPTEGEDEPCPIDYSICYGGKDPEAPTVMECLYDVKKQKKKLKMTIIGSPIQGSRV